MANQMETPLRRLNRAREHLDNLDFEVRQFFASNPYRVVREFDFNTLTHTFRVEIRSDPPKRLGILVGDCVHSLRASLDNLMWELSGIYRQNSRTRSRTSFPICKTPQRFGGFRRRGLFNKFDPAAIDAIKSLQPYHTPNPKSHPLSILDRLWNDDKHRTIPVLVAQTKYTLLSGSAAAERVTASSHVIIGRLYHGKVIATATVRQYPHPDLEPQFAIDVALDEPRGGPRYRGIVDALSELHRFVSDDVIARLQPFFPR